MAYKIKKPSIERNNEGYLVVSDVIGNHLVTRKYMGYSKKDAIRKFKQENSGKKTFNHEEMPNEFVIKSKRVMEVSTPEQKKVFDDFQSGTYRLFLLYLGKREITKENIDDVLKIMINSVEGDKSQLEEEHIKYGMEKGWFKGF